MSYQKQFIEIVPPNQGMEEVYQVYNHICTLCKGSGSAVRIMEKEATRSKTCSRCEGTGRLKAVIQIQWMIDY